MTSILSNHSGGIESSSSTNQHVNSPKIRRRHSKLNNSLKGSQCIQRISLSQENIISSEEPTSVDIEEVALCVCQQSQHYPLCDKTHETFNRETNSSIKPIYKKTFLSKSLSEFRNTCNIRETILETTSTEHENAITHQEHVTEPQMATLIPSSTKSNETSTTTPTSAESTSHPSSDIQQPDSQPPPVHSPSRQIRKIEDIKKITAEYTAEEVAKHCTRDDCWLIVYGKVYDVTAYFEFHPGGHQALLNFAGKDATENVQYHSSKMLMLLNKYFYIGKLKSDKDEASRCVIS